MVRLKINHNSDNNHLMEVEDPIPLIPWDDLSEELDLDNADSEKSPSCLSLKVYGYSILIASWMLFVVSINSIFEVWKFVIYPLSTHKETLSLYNHMDKYFSILDKYFMRFWGMYVVIWWWSIVSWCGLKLFRHSKGIQS